MKTTSNYFLKILLFSLLISCSKDDVPSITTPIVSCTDGIQNGNETGIDCGGDCPACPSSDKEIISVSFQDAPGSFDPIVQIDNDLNEVWIRIGKVFPTSDITNLSFDVEVSSGATTSTLPSNYLEPQSVTVTAEDGSSQEYTIIVSA